MKTIGGNIQGLRQEKGVKGETLAIELGVKKAYISQMENGFVDFKITTLHHVASVLNISFSTLINGIESVESRFADYRFQSEQHQRTINMLVCRIEYLNEQVECMRMERADRLSSLSSY